MPSWLHRSGLCAVALATLTASSACREEGGATPAASAATATATAPPASSTPPAVTASAIAPAPPQPCVTEVALPLGRLLLPEGHCARRVGEGDDLTAVLSDESGFPYARLAHLAHGAKVGDACRAVAGSAPQRLGAGSAVRCIKDDGRLCVAFHTRASLCAAAAAQNPRLERALEKLTLR